MTGETTYVHLDPELYYEIHNRAFDIFPEPKTDEGHNLRLDWTEAVVNLVREYAPTIMAHTQSQARVEAVIGEAIAHMLPGEEELHTLFDNWKETHP